MTIYRDIEATKRSAETIRGREGENENHGQKEFQDLTIVALVLVCIYILFLVTIGF